MRGFVVPGATDGFRAFRFWHFQADVGLTSASSVAPECPTYASLRPSISRPVTAKTGCHENHRQRSILCVRRLHSPRAHVARDFKADALTLVLGGDAWKCRRLQCLRP